MKKTLLILTGHSKGLGRSILDRFLDAEEIEVIAISRTVLGLQRANLREIQLDLADLESLEVSLPDIFPVGDFERFVLINNAGWIGEIKPVGKLDPGHISKLMNLNLLAPMVLTDAFAKAYSPLSAEKLVCNISSGAAYKPMPGWAEYCSSKAGLAMFSQVAAEDLAKNGVRVFSLAPGIVDTEMQAEIRTAELADFPARERFENFKREGSLSSPELVADKVFYLLAHPERFSDVAQDVRNFELP